MPQMWHHNGLKRWSYGPSSLVLEAEPKELVGVRWQGDTAAQGRVYKPPHSSTPMLPSKFRAMTRVSLAGCDGEPPKRNTSPVRKTVWRWD